MDCSDECAQGVLADWRPELCCPYGLRYSETPKLIYEMISRRGARPGQCVDAVITGKACLLSISNGFSFHHTE